MQRASKINKERQITQQKNKQLPKKKYNGQYTQKASMPSFIIKYK